jgi:hypothetical protein
MARRGETAAIRVSSAMVTQTEDITVSLKIDIVSDVV